MTWVENTQKFDVYGNSGIIPVSMCGAIIAREHLKDDIFDQYNVGYDCQLMWAAEQEAIAEFNWAGGYVPFTHDCNTVMKSAKEKYFEMGGKEIPTTQAMHAHLPMRVNWLQFGDNYNASIARETCRTALITSNEDCRKLTQNDDMVRNNASLDKPCPQEACVSIDCCIERDPNSKKDDDVQDTGGLQDTGDVQDTDDLTVAGITDEDKGGQGAGMHVDRAALVTAASSKYDAVELIHFYKRARFETSLLKLKMPGQNA